MAIILMNFLVINWPNFVYLLVRSPHRMDAPDRHKETNERTNGRTDGQSVCPPVRLLDGIWHSSTPNMPEIASSGTASETVPTLRRTCTWAACHSWEPPVDPLVKPTRSSSGRCSAKFRQSRCGLGKPRGRRAATGRRTWTRWCRLPGWGQVRCCRLVAMYRSTDPGCQPTESATKHLSK